MKNIKKYIILIFAELISAIAYNLLLDPFHLVCGGTSGLATILNSIVNNFNKQYFIYGVYVVTFLLSIIFLGKKSIIGLLIASITYPVFVDLTSNISNIIKINPNTEIFVIALFAGTICGISNGLIFKNGFPSSGISIIPPILNKYFKLSTTNCLFIMNSIILILGASAFGLQIVLFSIIVLYINNIISNKVILGKSDNKTLLINSNKDEDIHKFLFDIYKLDSIFINIDNSDKKLLLVVLPNYEYNFIKDQILEIDPELFLVTNDTYEYNEY